MQAATALASCQLRAIRYFNPRSLCRLRLHVHELRDLAFLISIPAAYAGCDPDESTDTYDEALFQSPQPMQAATP